MVLNSLSFCLSVKLLIYPSYLNEILAGYSHLGCRLLSFITLSMSYHSLLSQRVSIETSAVILMGIPLCVICFFSLAAFNIYSLCLIFVSLNNMCLALGFSGLGIWISWTWVAISFPILGNFSTIISPSIFLCPFFFVFFWDSYDSNVGAFDIFPEASEVVLISFNSFIFFFSLFHLFPLFYLPPLIFCFSYSTVGSVQSAFDLSYCIIY